MPHFTCKHCGKTVKSIGGLTQHVVACKATELNKEKWHATKKQKRKRDESTREKDKQRRTVFQTITLRDVSQSFLVDTHNAQLRSVIDMLSGAPSIRQRSQE